jgi:holo-[acyl-carrier protein] synthase
MVVGLGIDLVEWARVAKALERWGDRFVAKLMDPEEAERLPPEGESRVLALALAVAGKEAASKALGTGWSQGVRWRDVVVELGPPPRVTLLARAKAVARSLGSPGRARVTLEIRGELAVGEVRLLS